MQEYFKIAQDQCADWSLDNGPEYVQKVGIPTVEGDIIRRLVEVKGSSQS